MKMPEQPARLVDSSVFAGSLRAIAETNLAPARLQENAAVIASRVASLREGGDAGAGPESGAGGGALKLVSVLAALGVGVAIYVARPETVVESRPVVTHNETSPALQRTEPGVDGSKPEIPQQPERTVVREGLSTGARHPGTSEEPVDPGARVVAEAQIPAQPPGWLKQPSERNEEPTMGTKLEPSSPRAAARGELAPQLKIFHDAQRQVVKGNQAGALDTINGLLENYPTSSILPEALTFKAHLLTEMEEFDEAARVIESLLEIGTPKDKEASVYRLLGDVRTRQGRCGRAAMAYTRALELGLSETEAASTRRSLNRCEGR